MMFQWLTPAAKHSERLSWFHASAGINAFANPVLSLKERFGGWEVLACILPCPTIAVGYHIISPAGPDPPTVLPARANFSWNPCTAVQPASKEHNQDLQRKGSLRAGALSHLTHPAEPYCHPSVYIAKHFAIQASPEFFELPQATSLVGVGHTIIHLSNLTFWDPHTLRKVNLNCLVTTSCDSADLLPHRQNLRHAVVGVTCLLHQVPHCVW